MKSKTRNLYIAIVVLMVISLTGLVGIQVYWIRSMIVERTVEFESNIRRSMFMISRQVEAEEMEQLISRYSGFNTDALPKIKKDVNFTYMNSNPSTGESISLIQSLYKEETITIPLEEKGFNDSLRIRNFIEYQKVLKGLGNKELGDANTSYSIAYGIPDPNMVINHVHTQLSLIGEQQSLLQRIKPEKLINIIDRVLHENNINTPYQYAIMTNGELSSIHSPRIDSTLTAHTARLFVSSDGMARYELVLRFPHEMGFVLKSLIPMISATILFILIIIAAFALSIYYIIRQKKVADMKNDFINNMTHEFKTPIATISIAVDALRSSKVKESEEKTEHFLGVIKEENRRMLTQVESVLRIAKLERGQLDMKREETDLNSLLEEAIEHIVLIVDDRDGTIEDSYNADASTAYVDRMHITNVFLNLLDNANKYSPENPHIEVRTYNPSPDVWAIDVKDHGMGMSHNDAKKIFDNFYRIPTGDIHNIKGHGLGLAYSKKIIEMHGGSISVVSSLGKGSTFTIKLPLDRKEENN